MKALLLLLTISSAAQADDAAVLRCRAIADVPARVACYDAMPLSGTAAPATPRAAMAVATTPTLSANPAKDFGLSEIKRRPADEPNEIESSIVGKFDGWGTRTRFRLANGQLWRVVDDSEATLWERDNPKVRIVRNTLGTMFLEVEGSKQAPRVRREE